MIPWGKSSTLSGARWLARAKSLAAACTLPFVARRQIVEGYILEGKKLSNGQPVGRVDDTPAYLGFAGGYYTPDEAAPFQFGTQLVSLGRGRDALLYTPGDPGSAIPSALANPGLFTASTVAVGVVPVGLQQNPARHFPADLLITSSVLMEQGFSITLNFPNPSIPYEAEVGYLVFIQRPPQVPAELTRLAGDNGYELATFGDGAPATGSIFIGDNFFESFSGPLSRRDGMPWAFSFPAEGLEPLGEGGTYGFFVSAHCTAANKDESKRLSFSYLEVEYGSDPETPTVSGLPITTIAPASLPALAQPMLIPPSDPDYDGAQPRHYLNSFHPAYIAPVGGGVFATVVRYVAQREYPAASGLLKTYNSVYAMLLSKTAVGSLQSVVVPSTGEDYHHRQPYWFSRGVGMDSNGETAVYIGMHSGFPDSAVSDPGEYAGLEDSRAGVIRVTSSGVSSVSFFNLPFVPNISQLAAASLIVNDAGNFGPGQFQPSIDGVTYIGNNKFAFLATPFANAVYSTFADQYQFSEWDLALAIYDLDANSMSIAGVVRHFTAGEFTHTFDPIDKSSHNVSRVYCSRLETVDTPAALVVSFGVSYAGSAPMDVVKAPGETWLSDDSGVTWERIATAGHGRGAFFAGGVTYSHRNGIAGG